MNAPTDLDSPQSVLAAIESLLETSGAIDETRAKQVRKAVDALHKRNDDDTTDVPDAPAEDAGGTGEPDAPATESGDDALYTRIDSGLELLRERINRQVERRNRDYELCLQLMQEVEAALKANELHGAEQAWHKLLSIMGNIPGLSEQRWKDIEKRMNRVRPRLRKLESWRHWGTTQVRQELIEQIRQLPDAGLSPEQLAARIKEARAQWQEWDKSGDHAGKELWQTFDSTCEEIYKPAAEHFRKLKQTRRENLDKRRRLIETLNERYEATDWKAPDWRELDKYLRQVRRDFHAIGNVDFKHRKTLGKNLDTALDRFEQQLSRERERSLRARERLIAEIEALADEDNPRTALDRLDALKKQWIITVTGKRSLENRLWKRFQDACDGVYRKRDAVRKQHDAERHDNLQGKQALIAELAQLAAAADEQLLAGGQQLARIQERWQDIGAVPRKDETQLDRHWRAAQQEYRKALSAAAARARASEQDNLARRAGLCRQWEQATLAGHPVDLEQARAEWDALPPLRNADAAAMEQRFQQAFSRPADAALAHNRATLLDACLKLEVLLELESPPQFRGDRMAYQVERLNTSLKKGPAAQDSVEDLLRVVLTTGAVATDAAPEIEPRIQQCLAARRHR